jgi:hypothetical protein
VSGVTGRPESGLAGMRTWMQARAVSAVSARIAGLVDLFRSPTKPGTNNSSTTNCSVASFPAKKRQCPRWCPDWWDGGARAGAFCAFGTYR